MPAANPYEPPAPDPSDSEQYHTLNQSLADKPFSRGGAVMAGFKGMLCSLLAIYLMAYVGTLIIDFLFFD